MKLLSVTEYAALHNVDASTVRRRLRQGKHPEAVKVGCNWAIPADSPWIDHRMKDAKTLYQFPTKL